MPCHDVGVAARKLALHLATGPSYIGFSASAPFFVARNAILGPGVRRGRLGQGRVLFYCLRHTDICVPKFCKTKSGLALTIVAVSPQCRHNRNHT